MPGRQTQEAYDLLFVDPLDDTTPIGVMLARDPRRVTAIEEALEPIELGQVSPPRPVPVVWNDHRGGAGVAQPIEGLRGTYRMARNACTRFGRVVTPAGGLHEYDLSGLSHAPARINGFAAIGSDIVVLTNDNKPLLIRNYGAGPVVQGTTLAAGFRSEDATIFKGALWIGGGGDPDIVRFDGGTWQQSGFNSLRRPRLRSVTWTRQGVPRRRIVATNQSGSAILYTTGDNPHDPAHWSSEIPVESAWPIQRLVAAPRHVYATGPGGVFDLTENGETPNVLGETWEKNYDPNTGASATIYDGALYVVTTTSTWRVGLQGDVQDVLENVGIGHLQPAEIPVFGRPRALTTLDGWLVQVTYNSQTGVSQVWYAMRRERTGQPTPWPLVWHGSECDLEGLEVQAVGVATPTGAPRRLIFGCVDGLGNTRLMWQAISRYGSPLQDYLFGGASDRMDYARSWSITETYEDLGDPGSIKEPLWWDVLGRYLGGPNSLSVSVAGRDGVDVDQGTSLADDARFGAPRVSDKALRVTVTGANSESVPAVFDSIKGVWVLTVEEGATITVPVVFGQGVALLNGAEDVQDGDATYRRLVRLNEQGHVRVVRWNGEVLRVRVEQGIRRRWQESPDGQGWLDGAVLTMTVLSRPMRHDVGDQHDSGLYHDG